MDELGEKIASHQVAFKAMCLNLVLFTWWKGIEKLTELHSIYISHALWFPWREEMWISGLVPWVAKIKYENNLENLSEVSLQMKKSLASCQQSQKSAFP